MDRRSLTTLSMISDPLKKDVLVRKENGIDETNYDIDVE